MGYTAYRAWTTGATSVNPHTVALAKQGATLYSIQLALNLLWTPLYFSLGRPIAATVDILALGGTVGYLAYIWGQVDPTCGWLLAPYLGWLSFATYLCVSTSSWLPPVTILLSTRREAVTLTTGTSIPRICTRRTRHIGIQHASDFCVSPAADSPRLQSTCDAAFCDCTCTTPTKA